jgi:hypothetical protein
MITMKRTFALLSFAIATALLLAACGGSQASDDDGVASLDDGGGTASEAAASESPTDAEEALLEYVECLRGEGLDVPDPQVNADGQLQFGGPGGPGGGDGEAIDPEEFEAAQEVCGDPPAPAGGGNVDPEQQAEFQDAALAFTQCMRDRGYDMPDPEFEGEGGVVFRGGGPGLDADDPEQQAAAEECQEQAFGDLQPGGGSEAGGDGS